MNKMRDSILIVLCVIGLVALITTATLSGVYFLEKKECKEIGEALEITTKYGFWTNCLIEHNGKWLELEKYRYLKE